MAKAQKNIDSFIGAYSKSNIAKGIYSSNDEYYGDNYIDLDNHAHVENVEDVAFARFFPAKKQNKAIKTIDIEKIMKELIVYAEFLFNALEMFFAKVLEKTLLYVNILIKSLVKFDIACEKYIYGIHNRLAEWNIGERETENKFDNLKIKKIFPKKKVIIEHNGEIEYQTIPIRICTVKKVEKINKNIKIKENFRFMDVLKIVYYELRYGGKINW